MRYNKEEILAMSVLTKVWFERLDLGSETCIGCHVQTICCLSLLNGFMWKNIQSGFLTAISIFFILVSLWCQLKQFQH